MVWIEEILIKYAVNNNIRTNSENIKKACVYACDQGYDESIGLFFDALLADSKMLELLKGC